MVDGENPYTIPTGDGFMGVWTTERAYANVSIGTFDYVDWTSADNVDAIKAAIDGAVAIVDREDVDDQDRIIAEVSVEKKNFGTNIRVTSAVLREVRGLEPGGDIRAYKRDPRGLYLVAKAADPFVQIDNPGISNDLEEQPEQEGDGDG